MDILLLFAWLVLIDLCVKSSNQSDQLKAANARIRDLEERVQALDRKDTADRAPLFDSLADEYGDLNDEPF